MQKEAKDKHFIKQPIYEGGPSALKKFISDNMRYPDEAMQNKVEGTVYVKYDIDFQGNVVEAKVITGIGHGCDDEAIRLVKLLKFKVEKPRGIRILYHKNIQIHFRLPKVKEMPATTQFQYNLVPTKSAQEVKKPEQKKVSHTYTINF